MHAKPRISEGKLIRILYVNDGIYPAYSSKVTHEIAKRLVKNGCKVTVLASKILNGKMPSFTKEMEFIDGVKVIRSKAFLLNIASSSYCAYDPLSFRNLLKLIEYHAADNDIIHLQSSLGGMISLFITLSREYRKLRKNLIPPMVVTSHGIPTGYPSVVVEVVTRFLRQLQKYLIVNRCTLITTVATRDLNYWISNGVPRDIIRYIPNGVDTTFFKPSIVLRRSFRRRLGFGDEEIVVMFLAQLRLAKGVDVFLNAVPLISEHLPLRFLVAGTGPMVNYVKAFIKDHRLEKKTTVVPKYVPERDLPAFFNACDIYVLPSFVEGMPLSLMEAMACGEPVIATSVGDVPVLVKNGINGVMISPGNADQLAESIICLAENPKLRNLMAEANVRKMAKYDWDKIARQYHALYSEILNG